MTVPDHGPVRNDEGGVDTVHYEMLSVLLLNELQKQQRQLQERDVREQQQDDVVRRLQEQNHELADRLALVEALLSRVAAATTTGSR